MCYDNTNADSCHTGRYSKAPRTILITRVPRARFVERVVAERRRDDSVSLEQYRQPLAVFALLQVELEDDGGGAAAQVAGQLL